MRTTVADIRATNIPQVLGLCSDNSDGRLLRYLNEAMVRLIPKGQWRGTVVRYRFCAKSDCITMPRQVESVIAWALCDGPGTIRSHWFEFSGYGPGQFQAVAPSPSNSDSGQAPNLGCCGWMYGGCPCGSGAQLADRGLAVAFDDICGENKKIRVYLDNPSDAGKTILLQGWDQYRNPVITDDGAVDGESVTLISNPTTYVDTSTIWMANGLTGVQKEVTKGRVRLFELDTITGLQRPLAIYEPDETRPEYRRYLVPGLANGRCCNNNSPDTCTQPTVTTLVKLKFIPVVAETDYLLIGNYAALKDMCQSIKKREDNLIQEALAYEASARMVLEEELSNFHGDGTMDPVQVQASGGYEMDGVQSLI